MIFLFQVQLLRDSGRNDYLEPQNHNMAQMTIILFVIFEMSLHCVTLLYEYFIDNLLISSPIWVTVNDSSIELFGGINREK